MALTIELSQTIDPGIFENAMKEVVGRHDGFRLRFEKVDGHWRQFYTENFDNLFTFEFIELSTTPTADQKLKMQSEILSLQSNLNIKDGPLLKSVIFDSGLGKQTLFITCHHLVIDGISWRIILEDLEKIYDQFKNGKEIHLPAKTDSFQKWSEQLQKFAKSDGLKNELAFWQDNNNVVTQTPIDFPASGKNDEASAQTIFFFLSRQETDDLLHNSLKPYRSKINELLLTALAPVINQWTNEEIFSINLEGHGRENIGGDLDTSQTVGWFTSIYPVHIKLDKNDLLPERIKSVKEQFRKIPNNGIGYEIGRAHV